MSVDWVTVLVSGSTSAAVGVIVSLLAVPQTVVRQRRAERRDDARRLLEQAVDGLIVEHARYLYLRPPEPRRTNERSHMDDHGHVVRIRRAAADLSPLRRYLIDRRCRRVFGDYWTELARDLPAADTADVISASVGAWFAAERRGAPPADGRGPLDGLMQRAYSRPAGDPLVRKLGRELRRLRAAR